MYHRKPKCHTNYKKRCNALTSSDLHQAMQYLQASLVLSIYHQHLARNLLLLDLGMRCHHKHRDRFLFYATLFNYLQKVRQTKQLIGLDFLSITIFPEQEIHPTIPLAIHRTFYSLGDDWCYENTRFTVDQLHLIHSYIDLPPFFYMWRMYPLLF